ncbi:MAG: DUF3857 domain-containing protein, partial [Gammaproteobacteria bacterium]
VAPDLAAPVPSAQLSDGVYYLLLDHQTRVGAHSVQRYRHIAAEATNQQAVEDLAQRTITFDPSYQRLELHSVVIHRGSRVIDELGKATIHVIQREPQLAYQIYDGAKTATIILPDVRVGDVVEYSYTLGGANPVFQGHYSAFVDTRWGVPLHQLRERLLWPTRRHLYMRNHATDIRPLVSVHGAMTEYRWAENDVTPLVPDSHVPSWYDPFGSVSLSDFKTWREVAKWALPLYRVPDRTPPGILGLAGRIAAREPDAAHRAAAALHFVQRQVRYLGIELGPRSHAPNAPAQVLKQRFGDCKDKARLLVTLLRALGVQAHTALVNTDLGPRLSDYQPSPTLFDHAIVRARVNGRFYWLDPTDSYQQGPLDSLYQPDYGQALVVRAGSTGLVAMANAAHGRSRKRIVERFDLRAGVGKPARYTVQTTYEGDEADGMRAYLASKSRDHIQNTYLNFYARHYPSIAVAAPFTVKDDPRHDRVVVTEHYRIAHLWAKAAGGRRLQATFEPVELYGLVDTPDDTVRTMPLRIAYPEDVSETIRVLLPGSWPISPGTKTITDPAFHYSDSVRYADKRLELDYRFRTRADHVPVDGMAGYLKHLKQVNDDLGYRIWRRIGDAAVDPGHADAAVGHGVGDNPLTNWTVVLIAALTVGVLLYAAVSLYRRDGPVPRRSSIPVDPRLQGIRGWLLLPAIAVIVHPLLVMGVLAQSWPAYAPSAWSRLTTPGSPHYHALWEPLLLFDLEANLALLVFGALLLVMFFQKRRLVPRLFTVYLLGGLLVEAADIAMGSGLPAAAASGHDIGGLASAAVSAFIWVTYFKVSERVRATFVN